MILSRLKSAAIFSVVCCLAATGAVGAGPSDEIFPREISDIEGFDGGGLFLDGRVYISGQPNEAALAGLVGRGLDVVVNTRTPDEMSDREKVPFNEASTVRDLGLSYVEIPLGGDFPYDPTAAARLAGVLADHEGQVLIHCGYGGRAAYLWLAYLVEHVGLPLDQAMERGEAMMLKQHPIGRLLGRPTALVFVEEASVP